LLDPFSAKMDIYWYDTNQNSKLTDITLQNWFNIDLFKNKYISKKELELIQELKEKSVKTIKTHYPNIYKEFKQITNEAQREFKKE
jgi:TRAP-type C4-dicarboxylate transport system substrate-binding protein